MKLERQGNGILITIHKGFARLSGIFVFIGCIATILLWSATTQIICQQKASHYANQCIYRIDFYQYYHMDTDIGQLYSASVDVKGRARHNNGPTYAVMLNASHQTINLTGAPSVGREDKTPVAEAINQYIQSSDSPVFTIPYPTPLIFYLLVAVGACWGIRMVFFRDVRFLFDAVNKVVTISRGQRILTSIKQIPWDEINGVIIQKWCWGRVGPCYRLAINVNNRRPIPFTFTYRGKLSKLEGIAKQLNQTLGR